MFSRIVSAVCIAACLACGAERPAHEPVLSDGLQTIVDETWQALGAEYGIAVHVDSPELGIAWAGAAGYADPFNREPMTPEHPVRIASNTKTFVATTVLGLWEQGRLGLDDPVSAHLSREHVAVLRGDGYDPDLITVRHLLTHTSGLFDHGAAEHYADDIVADPQHRWSREEQLQICVDAGDPLGAPGEVYSYSDTGYILLGEIIEKITGGDLASGVWSIVDRNRLGLGSTWWETLEPRPQGAMHRAHQFFGDVDVSSFDPSFDLWGGGGVATTVGDLARFTRGLFSGQVYNKPETLETMLTTLDGLQPAATASERSLPPGSYRMGVWVLEELGYKVYRHTGFWCTFATFVPELDLVLTATVNQHEAGPEADEMMQKVFAMVVDHAEKAGARE
jgi:D-alanyl-D-alanine carboxypeptidase